MINTIINVIKCILKIPLYNLTLPIRFWYNIKILLMELTNLFSFLPAFRNDILNGLTRNFYNRNSSTWAMFTLEKHINLILQIPFHCLCSAVCIGMMPRKQIQSHVFAYDSCFRSILNVFSIIRQNGCSHKNDIAHR